MILDDVVKPPALVGFLVSLLLTACAAWQAPPQAAVDNLVTQSALAFEGKVVRLGAVTVAGIPATPHTVVVEVTEVLRGLPQLRARTGKLITVLVKDLSGLEPGSTAVFFANGWILGEGVAVLEVGRMTRYNLTTLRGQVAAAAKREALRPIEENLQQAELVIVGTVAKVRYPEMPAAAPARVPARSEHDPKFREAIVQIETVLKGEPQLGSVALLFPSSRDVAWYLAPKFQVGQQGIWILKTDPDLKRYLVIKPQDFLPRQRLSEVKKILARGR